MDNCCCENVGNIDCSNNEARCGKKSVVEEMTGIQNAFSIIHSYLLDDSGSDVEVICGEWEIGNISASLSGEKYNIILPITEIVRHPGKSRQNELESF